MPHTSSGPSARSPISPGYAGVGVLLAGGYAPGSGLPRLRRGRDVRRRVLRSRLWTPPATPGSLLYGVEAWHVQGRGRGMWRHPVMASSVARSRCLYDPRLTVQQKCHYPTPRCPAPGPGRAPVRFGVSRCRSLSLVDQRLNWLASADPPSGGYGLGVSIPLAPSVGRPLALLRPQCVYMFRATPHPRPRRSPHPGGGGSHPWLPHGGGVGVATPCVTSSPSISRRARALRDGVYTLYKSVQTAPEAIPHLRAIGGGLDSPLVCFRVLPSRSRQSALDATPLTPHSARVALPWGQPPPTWGRNVRR